MLPPIHPFRLRPGHNEKIEVVLGQRDASGPGVDAASASQLMSYWSAQQSRMGAHETARFAFSGFIVTGSLVALSAVADGQMPAPVRWAVVLSVVAANLLAVTFALSELRWVKIHQERARCVLRAVLPEVAEMQVLADTRWFARSDSSANHARFSSTLSLQVIHWLLTIGALVVGFLGGR